MLELELAPTSSRSASCGRQIGSEPNERLGAFAGQVSHDLKNPLSAIRLSVELARDEVET